LHMMTSMRSNDVYFGLPHDVFAFTFLQEIVARTLSLELGAYHHSVGSLHVYESMVPHARQFLAEGWQSRIAMPDMPSGDPWRSLAWLIQREADIRSGTHCIINAPSIDGYWQDLARLLRIKALFLSQDMRGIVRQKQAMVASAYDEYIRAQEQTAKAQQ